MTRKNRTNPVFGSKVTVKTTSIVLDGQICELAENSNNIFLMIQVVLKRKP